IAMACIQRIGWLPAWTKQPFQFRREQVHSFRSTVAPLEFDALTVMAKIGQVQLKPARGAEGDEPAHVFQEGRLAIRGKPHDLVFVSVARKTEKLSEGLIEDAERVRK